jgi:hypothetical protein
MTKYTTQDRFYIFAAVTLMLVYGYLLYHTHQQDKYMNEALEMNNKRTVRYVEINNEMRLENEGLKHNLIHEQAMYHASKFHVKMLEEQIDTISNYYRKEIIKVNDELFDLKNKGKNVK